MHARFFLPAVLALSVALLAACGGGDDDDDPSQEGGTDDEALSLEDYFEDLERIGSDADAELTEAEDFSEFLDIANEVAGDIADLTPPSEVETEHEAYINAIEETVDEIEVIDEENPELTLEEFQELDTPEFTAAADEVSEACAELQDIADEEAIEVDLDCGGSGSDSADDDDDGDEGFELPTGEEGDEEDDGEEFETGDDDDDDGQSSVANDDVSRPTEITSLPFSDTLDVSAATSDLEEPGFSCGDTDNTSTVWYIVESEVTVQLFVDTTGSDYDTVLAAYEPGQADVREVTCNDDFETGDPTSRIVFEAQGGARYLIGVAAYGSSGPGILRLIVDEASNNSIEGARLVDVLPYTDSEDTGTYTTDPSDPIPSCGSGQGGATAWYVVTPETAAGLVVGTAASDYDTVITVYQGSPGALTEVACNDDFEGEPAAGTFFTPIAGVTYYIEVSSYGTTAGGQLEFFVAQ